MLVLLDGNVVHFDLKAGNVFLDPKPGVSEAEFWMPQTEEPPFTVVIGDFGESKMWPGDGTGFTTRSRGTEYMKAPEMLRTGRSQARMREVAMYDRRKQRGAGAPCDVWALGCLLYELVFGEMMLFDPDYMRFFLHLTQGTGSVLTLEQTVVRLDAAPVVAKLIRPMMQRDPDHRPDLRKLLARLQRLQSSTGATGEDSLPPYSVPKVIYHDQSEQAPRSHDIEAEHRVQDHCSVSIPPSSPKLMQSAPSITRLSDDVLLAPYTVCRNCTVLLECAVECVVVLAHPRGAASLVQPGQHSQVIAVAAAAELPCKLVSVAANGRAPEAGVDGAVAADVFSTISALHECLHDEPRVLVCLCARVHTACVCTSPCV